MDIQSHSAYYDHPGVSLSKAHSESGRLMEMPESDFHTECKIKLKSVKLTIAFKLRKTIDILIDGDYR